MVMVERLNLTGAETIVEGAGATSLEGALTINFLELVPERHRSSQRKNNILAISLHIPFIQLCNFLS